MDKPGNSVDHTERLDSWKEIAAYLKRGTRTVQRWEASGLPVRRLELAKRGAVYAYKAEIDLWWRQRSDLLTDQAISDSRVSPGVLTRWRTTGLIGAVILVIFALLVAKIRTPRNLRLADARRLTWEGNIITPALSPDGKWIAFASPRLNADANFDLWLRPANGGDLRRITATPGQEFDPSFAPDSRRILYSLSELKPTAMMELEGPPPPSATSLYETGMAGPPRMLMAAASEGRYSHDGRWIALLHADSSSGGLEFGIMPAQGGEFVPIPVRSSTNDILQSSSAAVWSPDNRFILLSARTLHTARYGWWLVNVASRTATLTGAVDEMMAAGFVTPPLLAGMAPQAWLPDGTVLTKGFGSGGISIWGVKLDSLSGRIHGRTAQLPVALTEIRWFSVAGDRILFDGGESLGGLDIVPFDLDHGQALGPPHTFRPSSPGAYLYLSLSGDGRNLAFGSRQSSGAAPGAFIADLETGKETRIASPSGNPAVSQQYTAISSSGKRVAYSILPSAQRPVYLWDSGAGTSELTTADCACRPLSWTPDERGLLVTLPAAHPQSIAFFDIGTQKISEILANPSRALNFAQVSPDGRQVLITTTAGAGFVAPFHGSLASPESGWKNVGIQGQSIIAMFWSPNGKRILFAVAERAGTQILSQTFDAIRGEPVGSPTEAYRTDWKPAFGTKGITGIVAGGNRIVLPTGTVTSDLWTAHLARGE